MSALVLFVDLGDIPPGHLEADEADAVRPYGAWGEDADRLVELLGPYLPHLEIVLSAPWTAHWDLEAIRDQFPSALAERVSATLWASPPAVRLTRYEHIRYWAARTYVRGPPSWRALDDARRGWPQAERRSLTSSTAQLGSPSAREDVLKALGAFDWSELWWGEEPAPTLSDRERARSLMYRWCVRRADWPALLGTTQVDFEQRLDRLLAIHAAVLLRPEASAWRPHWAQLPKAELGMRSPVKVIAEEGLAGIERVHALVWDALGST